MSLFKAKPPRSQNTHFFFVYSHTLVLSVQLPGFRSSTHTLWGCICNRVKAISQSLQIFRGVIRYNAAWKWFRAGKAFFLGSANHHRDFPTGSRGLQALKSEEWEPKISSSVQSAVIHTPLIIRVLFAYHSKRDLTFYNYQVIYEICQTCVVNVLLYSLSLNLLHNCWPFPGSWIFMVPRGGLLQTLVCHNWYT